MLRATALALGSIALAVTPAGGAGADEDDAVVVIRGSSVSVARPLTAERARDGSAEVEIVRVEPAAPPAAARRPPEPERELVVVLLPAESEPPTGVAWAAWPWAWDPAFHHPHHRPPHAHRKRGPHPPPGFHPLGLPRGGVRKVLHGR
jgi:hypothetical protein